MTGRSRTFPILPALLAGALLAACSTEPTPEALESIDADRLVETGDYYHFQPETASDTCFVFYPGGLVDPLGYAPLMQNIADAGYHAILLEHPFDLAVLDGNAADDILAAEENPCAHVVLSGHSLGGVMAARYALDEPTMGLLLLAAYPMDGDDLTGHTGAVVTIGGENDQLTTVADIENSLTQLPDSTKKIIIGGGNHAQFGWYGEQDGDGVATIAAAEQQQIVLQNAVRLLEDIRGRDQ